MEQADERLTREFPLDRLHHPAAIVDQIGDSMIFETPHPVPPVVAEVVDEDFEPVRQPAPERQVSVRGQAVPVGHEQARPVRDAMPADMDDAAVPCRDIEHIRRFRYLPAFLHPRSSPVSAQPPEPILARPSNPFYAQLQPGGSTASLPSDAD